VSPADLILYHLPGCGYCRRVERVLDELGLEIEHRNILDSSEHRDELRRARGRTTVPVLRIREPDGTETWMPESLDIVAFLRKRFG
jgi:glutaredoxin